MAKGMPKDGPIGRTPASRYGAIGDGDTTAHDPTSGANPSEVGGAVLGVIRSGDAILIGLTSDGGAVRLQIFEGDNRFKLYASNADELHMRLQEIIELTT